MPDQKYIPPSDQMFADLGLLDLSSGKLTFDPTGGTGSLWDNDQDERLDQTFDRVDSEGKTEPRTTTGVEKVASAGDPKANIWESDENPYRKEALENRAAQPTEGERIKGVLANNIAFLEAKAEEAYTYLTSLRNEKGEPMYDPRAVAAQIKSSHELLVQKEQMAAERAMTQPIAQRQVAEDIVRQVGGNATVDDIINLPTPQAMHAVAVKLRDLPRQAGAGVTTQTLNPRDAAFQARRESGADKTEAGAGFNRSIQDSLEKLTPQQRIAYSLRYQSQS